MWSAGVRCEGSKQSASRGCLGGGVSGNVGEVSYTVGYFVGSLSSTSINRVLSKALVRLAPEDLEFSEIHIGDLPLYSPDYDANYPPEATASSEAVTIAARHVSSRAVN